MTSVSKSEFPNFKPSNTERQFPLKFYTITQYSAANIQTEIRVLNNKFGYFFHMVIIHTSGNSIQKKRRKHLFIYIITFIIHNTIFITTKDKEQY